MASDMVERETLRAAFLDALQPFIETEYATAEPWREAQVKDPEGWAKLLPPLDAGIDAIVAALQESSHVR